MNIREFDDGDPYRQLRLMRRRLEDLESAFLSTREDMTAIMRMLQRMAANQSAADAGSSGPPVKVDPNPVLHERALTLLRLMRPYGVENYNKVRIGSSHDGGYVCLDDFVPVRTSFSFGIGGNDSADLSLAERGINVFQFDHTVDEAPSKHPNLHFYKEQVVPTPREGGRTLKQLLAEHDQGDHSVMLKIDIEQDEWPVFEALSASDLKPIRQITGEFHGFDFINDDAYYNRIRRGLEKLHENFFVCHVHANNYAPLMIYGGVPIPAVFELTYANRAVYKAEDVKEVFPTPLDQACNPAHPDFVLGCFWY